ncbi:MAG TPA: MarR family transcriptional regulator [Streptosporangiaceae bacterium]|nr:MarR family transcriptional regulator [Streptosporangiaceae bacterium]
MSTHADDHAYEPVRPPAPVAGRLGLLLDHAQLRLAELSGAALAPYGINGRHLAVLSVLAGGELLSQQEAARLLAIDRTTIVTLIDELERMRIVARHPHPGDRRNNVVDLTDEGRALFDKARRAAEEAERRFLAPLDDATAQRLRDSLHRVVIAGPPTR